MILAVNIGNTNIRSAAGQNGLDFNAAIPSDLLSCGKDFTDFIERRFGFGIWERLEGSIVSSVVPVKTPLVVESIISKTGKTPRRIETQGCGGLNVRQYDGYLGEDRVVCCAGALNKYEPPFIVIDFGTATTVNVVDGDSSFLGGAILAGIQIGLKALSDHTAQLPLIEAGADIPVIGKGTKENLLSGAIIGAACAAEGYIRRIEHELGKTVKVIVTGGHAPLILPYIDSKIIHEPNLVLDGLLSVFNYK